MQIIGIKVISGVPSVIKNLKPETWYPFGDYTEPMEQNNWTWTKDKDDDLLSVVYKTATEESFLKTCKYPYRVLLDRTVLVKQRYLN